MADRVKEFKHAWEPEYLEMTRDFIFRNTFKDVEWILGELGARQAQEERRRQRVRKDRDQRVGAAGAAVVSLPCVVRAARSSRIAGAVVQQSSREPAEGAAPSARDDRRDGRGPRPDSHQAP